MADIEADKFELQKRKQLLGFVKRITGETIMVFFNIHTLHD
jgi:hypothetical protein